MRKYEFTGNVKDLGKGHIVKEIRALADFGTVKAGDIGGWIEFEDNLPNTTYDSSWVDKLSTISGSSKIYDSTISLASSIADSVICKSKIKSSSISHSHIICSHIEASSIVNCSVIERSRVVVSDFNQTISVGTPRNQIEKCILENCKVISCATLKDHMYSNVTL